MVVPNNKLYYHQTNPSYSNKLSTISLSNCFLSSLDYRMHSSFRNSIKPRQAYASVNVKLLEQRPSSKHTSSCMSRGMRPNTVSTKYTDNMVSDDEYERIGTPSTASNDPTAHEHYTFTKDAFRPSAIRKLSKINMDDNLDSSRNISSKFVNNLEEHKMRGNIQSAAVRPKTTITVSDNKSLYRLRELNSKSQISNTKKLKSIL